MEFRDVEGTDLKVSRVALGTMTFGEQVDRATATRMVDLALDAGVNLLDTANVYAGGGSEEIVGSVLQGRRDEVLLATKVGNPREHEGPPLHPTLVRRSLTRSLERLRTGHVDIFYLHRPDPGTPIDETLGALHELVAEGLVRYVGVSNFAAWRIVEMQAIAERIGERPVRISQPVYNLLARRIEEEYLECAERRGITNIVYNPLAGGLLTGKHDRRRAPAAGTRYATKDHYRRRYWRPAFFDAADDLTDIAGDAGLTLQQLAFAWLLAQPQVDSVLVGASGPQQLADNLRACRGGSLPSETLDRCDGVWERLRGDAPAYTK